MNFNPHPKTRQPNEQTGQIRHGVSLNSLIFGLILFVLLPTYLLGNLFVATFPPKSSAKPADVSQASASGLSDGLVATDTDTSTSAIGIASQSTKGPPPSVATGDATTDVAADRGDSDRHFSDGASSTLAGGARVWTATDGRQVTAEFVSVADGMISLRRNGKLFAIPVSSVSQTDRDYIADLPR